MSTVIRSKIIRIKEKKSITGELEERIALLANDLEVPVGWHLGLGDSLFLDFESNNCVYYAKCGPKKKGLERVAFRVKNSICYFLDFFLAATFSPEHLHDLRKALSVPGKINVLAAMILLVAAKQDIGEGHIVEIGSFKGRSTAALAIGNRGKGDSKVVAIDPHYLGTEEAFIKNMERLDLIQEIDMRVKQSVEVVREWSRPIRILWIDGNHQYNYVKQDIKLWQTFLIDGGLLLLDDSDNPGVKRCIQELVQNSQQYSSIGRVEKVTWAVRGTARFYSFLEKFQRLERLRELLLKPWGVMLPKSSGLQ